MKLLAVMLLSSINLACEAPRKDAPPASAPANDGGAKAPEIVEARLGDKRFRLELAADEPTRIKGLAGREALAEDGGMLFVFPEPLGLAFVMRDCVIPIDIAFLDSSGRVVATHTMKVEPPRRADESAEAYEARLPRYESRFAAQFAVEVRAGTLEKLGVRSGDVVKFDAPALKRRAR